MKFCQRRRLSYTGLSGTVTTSDYVTIEDVEKFHGLEFSKKWLEFIKNKPLLKEGFYYYADYQFAARQADSFLNQI